MEGESEHPLLTKRMGGAFTVLALGSGVGLALMGFGLISSGLIIATLGGIGAIWIYWSDFKRLRLRLATSTGSAPLSKEFSIVLLVLLIGSGAPVYAFLDKTWSSPRLRAI